MADDNRAMQSPLPSPAPLSGRASRPFDGALRLADWGLIRATGDDAVAFLQGQLTQDVTAWRSANRGWRATVRPRAA
jgi:hypothetical protein